LAEAIDRAIPNLPASARVVNISLGTDVPIVDHAFSLVANVIDHLVHERDIVVVVSAGNIRDRALVRTYPAQVHHPSWRIDPPGEALLALTVGGIAHFTDANTISAAREMSAFSRRGPGADGGLKPELVAHAGNCFAVDPYYTQRIATLGVHGDGRQVACDVGTSFSAPLVARDAAILFDYFKAPTANLVRALLCHFTRPAAAPNVGMPSEHLIGLGEPDIERARQAGPHSAAFLHSGRISADVYRYIPFFVPSAMVGGSGAGHLRIRVTIAMDPPVNPQSPAEYSKCRLSTVLRKRVELGFRDVSVTGDSVEGARWSPIDAFEKTFRRGYDFGPWELRLRLWTRELPDDYLQTYSVVIEIIDDSGTVDVWREVEAEAGAVFRPIQTRIAAA
jgi:hypothetical protein